jgi:predicted RNA binding protein YcfA (HicA-like mRNA interferase family)
MSPRLRRLTSRQVLNLLGKHGFAVVSTRGSHVKLRRICSDGTRQILTVPSHGELAPGTLRAIYRQALRFISEEKLKPCFYQ